MRAPNPLNQVEWPEGMFPAISQMRKLWLRERKHLNQHMGCNGSRPVPVRGVFLPRSHVFLPHGYHVHSNMRNYKMNLYSSIEVTQARTQSPG